MIVIQKPPWKPSLAPLGPLPSPWQKTGALFTAVSHRISSPEDP